MQVNLTDARNNLSRLIARATAGEDVVIAQRDVPRVRLVPVAIDALHGRGDTVVRWLDAHPLPERLTRGPVELDADIAAARAGWA